jgi:hypothetical protein
MKFDIKSDEDGCIAGTSKMYRVEGWTNSDYIYLNFMSEGVEVVKF